MGGAQIEVGRYTKFFEIILFITCVFIVQFSQHLHHWIDWFTGFRDIIHLSKNFWLELLNQFNFGEQSYTDVTSCAIVVDRFATCKATSKKLMNFGDK